MRVVVIPLPEAVARESAHDPLGAIEHLDLVDLPQPEQYVWLPSQNTYGKVVANYNYPVVHLPQRAGSTSPPSVCVFAVALHPYELGALDAIGLANGLP
jgi:hypothetical protein